MCKLWFISFLAVCLLPDTTLSQGFCGLCNPSCSVRIGNEVRRLNYFDQSLYYFEEDKKKYTWKEANSKCIDLFQFPNYPGRSGNLASFQNIQGVDFLVNKMKEFGLVSAYIGGIRNKSNIYEWTWTDGTPMNTTLVPSKKPGDPKTSNDELWANNKPGYWNKADIMYLTPGKTIADMPDTNPFIPYICRIPCSTATIKPLIGRPECRPENYKSLTDAGRKTGSKGPWFCDIVVKYNYSTRKYSYGKPSPDWEGSGWYRFEGAAGDKMQMSAPGRNSCGTNVGVWLASPLPKHVGESLDAKYCEAYDQDKNKCKRSFIGKVTKCDGYFVYKLSDTYCTMRYCGTNEPVVP